MTQRGGFGKISLAPVKRQTKTNDTERYRSGHNEAVLKTVCLHGRVGSNPTLSAWILPERQNKKLFLYIRSKFGEVPKLAEGAPLERE